ncbi:Protein phosphatase 1 regulatory subunit 37 [Mizuhopecten yessoensis]|uniref:Protein phosphatase 1 regulatory subunit 37 n=1 Tax=Mizuhopecten yessoensis TaxID=6573 RepID=A0A210PGW0_MIZYE|nr:Protein phosphatase 1 regulatory subunit 37 [Mizuhopecten yessoensis]
MTDSSETADSVVISDTGDTRCVRPAGSGTAPSMDDSDMQEVNKSATGAESNSTEDTHDGDNKKIGTTKRNICFREPHALATYSEAPDPWKNAEVWNNTDLITAYRNGCEQNNVRPLSKVLNQLQGIQNTGERHELLSLKAEKLDIRHCESLEEVLRRVQFKCIDLEACHLDDETSVALFDMIEYYESACRVNMSFNKNISVRGWQSCSRMIRKTPCLFFLDARNCDLNDRLIPVMGRALRMGSFLTTLHLESTSLSGRPLVILVAALKMNEILMELFLADNRLMPSDGIQLGNLLKYNHKLQLLDIRNNHLQDIGASHVCDGLCEQNLGNGLQTLVFWNNQITYNAMTAVGKAMATTDSVETLNLGHNNVTNEGIHLMKDGLLKSKSLLRIGLQGTKVTCEGAVALAEVIADSPRLLRLDLRENEIKTAGLMALSLALKVNETVTRLDMDRDTKRESGMKDFAEQQRRLQQDINNFLERNQGLARKRTEEERLDLERTIKEDTRPGRSDSIIEPAETAKEDAQTIASFDKIKRPMLLVMEDRAAQKTLDSPHVKPENLPSSGDEDENVLPSNKALANAATPPAELLLSPQYCTVKAKKLFTVSRVAGPPHLPLSQAGMSAGHSASSRLDTVLSPSDTNDLIAHISNGTHVMSQGLSSRNITSPSDVTLSIQAENVNHIIDELVTGVSDTNLTDEKSSGELTFQENIQKSCLESESKSCEDIVDSHDLVTQVDGNNATISDQGEGQPSVNEEFVTPSNSEVEVNESATLRTIDSVCDNSKQSEEASGHLVSAIGDVGNGDNSVEEGCNSGNMDSVADRLSGSLPELDITDCDQTKQNCEKSNDVSNDSQDMHTLSKSLPCDKLKQEKDSGIGSYENDRDWTRLDAPNKGLKTNGCGSRKDGPGLSINNPDFYSDLTLNGLTQELASALENLDVDSAGGKECLVDTNKKSCGTVDDFEKELDAMLADVKSGSNLNLPSFQSSNPGQASLHFFTRNTVIFNFRCGLAGETGPRCIIPSEIKNAKSGKIVKLWDFEKEDELYENIKDFLFVLYFRHLLLSPKNKRVVVCESLLCPIIFREALAKVLFIHYEVATVMFASGHVMSLLTLGSTTGLVMDIGFTETLVIPVYEGIPVVKAIQCIPLAAKAIHGKIENLLLDSATVMTDTREECPLSGLPDCLNEQILEDIKVRCCFVTNLKRAKAIQEVVIHGADESMLPTPPPSVQYPLDGGKVLNITGKVREQSCEVLFEQDNEEQSVTTSILDAILKCPIDMRLELASNIVIIGGTSMLKGFHHRIGSELYDLLRKPKYREQLSIRTFKFHKLPAKENYAAWLGGAMMGSLETLPSRSVTRDSYQLSGKLADWCSITEQAVSG